MHWMNGSPAWTLARENMPEPQYSEITGGVGCLKEERLCLMAF